MTTAATPFPVPSDPGGGALPLGDLERRLRAARASDEPQPEDLLEELEVAYEELRTADEEMRAQRESIERLVDSHRSLRLQQERTMTILPVPVVVTDAHGIVRSVNAAAAALARMRVSRLQGRPIFGLFAVDDRRELRSLVTARGRGELDSVRRRTATLEPRGAEPVTVEVTASVQLPGGASDEISWVLLAPGDRDPGLEGGLAETLMALAVLGRRRATAAEVLHDAARLCASALECAVTISLGHPASPTALTSSCQLAQECDGAQLAAGEGPSVSAFESAMTVAADLDGAGGSDWPRLAGRLPAAGATVVAVPLRTGEAVAGTITAYRSSGAQPQTEAVELLAVTLSGVLHELELFDELAHLETDMERALASRAVIDQAKGIVMAARGVDADAAWEHLVKLSNTHQVKLRELAASMVEQVVRRS
jgi:PAS domain-containing protein